MIPTEVRALADAILYEGYLLYPYRPSALKNRNRWMFGCLFPEECRAAHRGAEACSMQTECLVLGNASTRLQITVRFLHLAEEERGAKAREIACPEIGLEVSQRTPFVFAESGYRGVQGEVAVSSAWAAEGLFRLTLRITNRGAVERASDDAHAEAMLQAMASTHTLFNVRDGNFVSSIDPPERYRRFASECRNEGAWPVLVGPRGATNLMLSAPIILSDYPQIAPESQGDLFDATEIDEMLALRIRTLTEREKQEAAASDPRARELIERVEAFGADALMKLHGADRASPFRPGDRVRLRPRGRADAFDILLAGKAATVASVERDFEDRIFIAVTIDEDPGRDLGIEGKPGHRFFFQADEVELLTREGE